MPRNQDFAYYFSYFIKHDHSNALVEVEEVLVPFIDKQKGFLVFKISNKNTDGCSSKKKIFLYAQSDTLAHSCSIVYKELCKTSLVRLFFPAYKDEGAQQYFKDNNLDAEQFSYKKLNFYKPDILILLNDWSIEAKSIIAFCRYLKISTVCIQESIIDFGDKFKRMEHADSVFMQGIQSVLDLERKSYYLTGNPRYLLSTNQFPLEVKKALINSNFTYNIYEEEREKWLLDITQVLTEHNIDYYISQHPRDLGDLSCYGDKVLLSNSSSIVEQIAKSDIVITRFSSLIHESLTQKKKVIYYNPHGENMKYNFRFNNKFLFLCKSIKDIENTLTNITTSVMDSEINDYLICHTRPRNNSPQKNIRNIVYNEYLESKKFTWRELIDILKFMFLKLRN